MRPHASSRENQQRDVVAVRTDAVSWIIIIRGFLTRSPIHPLLYLHYAFVCAQQQSKDQTSHHQQSSLFTFPSSTLSLCEPADMAMASSLPPGFTFHRPTQSTPKVLYESSRDKPLPLVSIMEKGAELDLSSKKNAGPPRSYSHYRVDSSQGTWLDSLSEARRVSAGSSAEATSPYGECLIKLRIYCIFSRLSYFAGRDIAEPMPSSVNYLTDVKNQGWLGLRV
jgi:hypothetical protein